MSIIYIYLYMHYMLKRRVEQWLGGCVWVCERGKGWEICRLRESNRDREHCKSAIWGKYSELYEKHIRLQLCSYSRWLRGWGREQGLGYFVAFFIICCLFDSYYVWSSYWLFLFYFFFLNSLFAASLWFLFFFIFFILLLYPPHFAWQ